MKLFFTISFDSNGPYLKRPKTFWLRWRWIHNWWRFPILYNQIMIRFICSGTKNQVNFIITLIRWISQVKSKIFHAKVQFDVKCKSTSSIIPWLPNIGQLMFLKTSFWPWLVEMTLSIEYLDKLKTRYFWYLLENMNNKYINIVY